MIVGVRSNVPSGLQHTDPCLFNLIVLCHWRLFTQMYPSRALMVPVISGRN